MHVQETAAIIHTLRKQTGNTTVYCGKTFISKQFTELLFIMLSYKYNLHTSEMLSLHLQSTHQ
jgi:hypothetical protein